MAEAFLYARPKLNHWARRKESTYVLWDVDVSGRTDACMTESQFVILPSIAVVAPPDSPRTS